MMTLGEKIRKFRNKMGLSQEKLSKMIGVAPRLVSDYENNKVIPSTDIIKRMVEIFAVTADYLIFENNKGEGIIKDRELLQQMEIVDNMTEEEKNFIKRLLRALIVDNRLRDIPSLESSLKYSNEERSLKK